MRLRSAALVAALLLVGASTAAAAYTCDAATCPTASCACASTSPPGGLDSKDIPMFVLLTHDDAVNTMQNRVVRTVTDGYKNKNGCNVPATWFTMKGKTNCTFVQQLVKDNHEIAGHTLDHLRLAPNVTDEEMKRQVEGVKTFLVDVCGVPAEKFKGFRAPYLVHSERLRNILQEAGYEYDSSIIEPFNTATSPSWADRTFPYSMDAGIPQDCAWTSDPDTSCSANEKHPGLWEVPVWLLPNAAGENAFSMDPEAASADDLFNLLKTDFDAAYNGNRAPFPVFVHAPWFTTKNTEGVLKFMDYATKKDDVWFVTMSQLLDWMKSPVPASQVGNRLTCDMVELTPPTLDYCRQYKVGPQEDIWTVGGKWGVSTDEELVALNPGINQWNIAEGTIMKLPPWDDRCEKKGAAFFPDANWYSPVYIQKTWAPAPAPSEPVKATVPAPAPVAVAVPAPSVDVDAPAPAPATADAAAASAPAPAVVEVPTPISDATGPAITTPGDNAPVPIDARSGAVSPGVSAAALLMAGVAALCLLF